MRANIRKTKEQVLSDEPTGQKPLRLRPGVVIVALQWLVWFATQMDNALAPAIPVQGQISTLVVPRIATNRTIHAPLLIPTNQFAG